MESSDKKWETVKEFTHPVGDRGDLLVVRVERLALWMPRYSFKLGTLRDGKFLPFFAPQVRVENARVILEPLGTVIDRMVSQAEAFICQVMQERGDTRIEQQQRRERELAERAAGPPQNKVHRTMPPREGKTARDRDKPGGVKTNDPTLSQKMRGAAGGGGKKGK